MKYYHFTSKSHWQEIQESGVIKTTCSNLLPPDPETFKIENGVARDKNWGYRQVVWLTNQIKPVSVELGLCGACESKTAVRITIDTDKVPNIRRWKHFADEAHMDRDWRKKMENFGKPSAWFVIENEIPLECVSSVDILE